MTPERWQQICDLLEQALELAPEQHSAFLNHACSSDPSLRQEVETLIAAGEDVRTSFLQALPLEGTAASREKRNVAINSPELAKGTRLGEYEIVFMLGAGGMGEVYRAKDTRLGRDVAIKVLRRHFSWDADRLRRFQQEARAAAALNHDRPLAEA